MFNIDKLLKGCNVFDEESEKIDAQDVRNICEEAAMFIHKKIMEVGVKKGFRQLTTAHFIGVVATTLYASFNGASAKTLNDTVKELDLPEDLRDKLLNAYADSVIESNEVAKREILNNLYGK